MVKEFAAPEGYLRGIVCEVVGTTAKEGMEWSNPDVSIAAALDDPEFSVQVHATLALTELIVVEESVRSHVAPQVGKAVQDPLKFLDETDLGIVNHIGMDGSASGAVSDGRVTDVETSCEVLSIQCYHAVSLYTGIKFHFK
ncbi:hypothetical protein D9757_011682 [Collybiopsis confluens]|uniref:Uncharacterized protein n=1 Tax=Collybiopsis confluens TaxID=2823264 RepID=A0A8H5GLR2_9AGAR|nr:hypothetical protein D9757_011682 [Collybiopsis confluens]